MRVPLPGATVPIDFNPNWERPEKRSFEFVGAYGIEVASHNIPVGEQRHYQNMTTGPGTLEVDAAIAATSGAGLRVRNPENPLKSIWLPWPERYSIARMAFRPTGADPYVPMLRYTGVDLLDAQADARIVRGDYDVELPRNLERYGAALILDTMLRSFPDTMLFGIDPRASTETRRVAQLLDIDDYATPTSSRLQQHNALTLWYERIRPLLGSTEPAEAPGSERFQPPTRRLAAHHAAVMATNWWLHGTEALLPESHTT